MLHSWVKFHSRTPSKCYKESEANSTETNLSFELNYFSWTLQVKWDFGNVLSWSEVESSRKFTSMFYAKGSSLLIFTRTFLTCNVILHVTYLYTSLTKRDRCLSYNNMFSRWIRRRCSLMFSHHIHRSYFILIIYLVLWNEDREKIIFVIPLKYHKIMIYQRRFQRRDLREITP